MIEALPSSPSPSTPPAPSSPLAAHLAEEYGDLVPPSLIDRAVDAARAATVPGDAAVADTARADVAAIAQAVVRGSGTSATCA